MLFKRMLKLKSLNNLTSDTIYVGQKLKINNIINYTVKKGDSLWKIAKSYKTTINDIVNLNNLKSTTIIIGQVLLIPFNN